MKTLVLVCFALFAVARTVEAGVCVVIDPSRDTLPEPERNAARGILLTAFESEKLAIDATGAQCTETYTVSNIKLGNTINVTIAGPRGTRTGRASSLDDLSNVYSQMVKSLVTGAAMETGGGTTDRTNVTKEQSAPRRVAADNLKYLALGYGAVTTRGLFAHGPAFAGGYRKELDRIALDMALSFLLGNDSADNDGMSIALRLMVLLNQDPIKDSTVYYGGGVSYGSSWVGKGITGEHYSGSGLQLHGSVGYAAFRSSTIRVFLQADLTLPAYKTHGYAYDQLYYDDARSETDTGWSPSLIFTLGFGWGKTTQVVRVINE